MNSFGIGTWAEKKTCFQFVKRMNGNLSPLVLCLIYSMYSCFQFVKRMNGNTLFRYRVHVPCDLLPIREAYEWKPFKFDGFPCRRIGLLPIREAYEWKRFVVVLQPPQKTLLASNS